MPENQSPDLEVQYVPLATLHPNPWNPNRMDTRTYAAERESIQMYGFVDPITCRPHPTIIGEYEILDGEHRHRAANEEGITEVPIVVLPLDDAKAKKLTIILNETRGEADPVSLSVLLHELDQLRSEGEDLLAGLPYTEKELAEFLKIGSVDWDTFDAEHPDAEKPESPVQGGTPRFLHLTKDQAKQYDDLVEMVMRENGLETPEEAVLLALRQFASTL